MMISLLSSWITSLPIKCSSSMLILIRAEEYSLAHQLKLEDKVVRKVLEKLRSHGILKEKQLQKQFFHDKFADKLAFDRTKVYYPSNYTRVTVYCFNKDLMFILKARMHMLKQKAHERVSLCNKNTSFSLYS